MRSITKTTLIIFVLIVSVSFAQEPFENEKIIIDTTAIGVGGLVTVDLDGDGLKDVLSSSADDNTISWYRNEGGGVIGSRNIIDNNRGNVQHVIAADVNGDGTFDPIVASYVDGKVLYYPNDGSGNFSTPIVVNPYIKWAMGVAAADLDGDGDTDIVSLSRYKKATFVHINQNGIGTQWETSRISSETIFPRWVKLADMDGDSDLDVLVSSVTSDDVSWFENNGTAGGWIKHLIDNVDGVHCAEAVDIDGDSDLDVLVAKTNDGIVSLYINEDGIYLEKPLYYTEQPKSVTATDIDGDGDLDVVASSYVGNKVFIVYNNDGFVDSEVIEFSAQGAWCVYADDFDQDGDVDLFSASSIDSTLAVYKNLRPDEAPVVDIIEPASDISQQFAMMDPSLNVTIAGTEIDPAIIIADFERRQRKRVTLAKKAIYVDDVPAAKEVPIVLVLGSAKDDKGVKKVRYYLSGATVDEGEAIGLEQWTTPELKLNDGITTVRVEAEDEKGQIGIDEIDIEYGNPIEIPKTSQIRVTYLVQDNCSLWMTNPTETKLLDKKSEEIVSQIYYQGEELNFFIDNSNGKKSSNSKNKHYAWGQVDEETGKPYCKVEKQYSFDGTLVGWILNFETDSGIKADWDYNDIVVQIELLDIIPEEDLDPIDSVEYDTIRANNSDIEDVYEIIVPKGLDPKDKMNWKEIRKIIYVK